MEKVGGDLSKFYGLFYKEDRLIGDLPGLMCQLDSKYARIYLTYGNGSRVTYF